MVSFETQVKVKASAGALTGLALCLTLLCLWIRVRIRRLWWEDGFAVVAFVCGVANITSEWIFITHEGHGDISVNAEWIYMFTFTCVIWAVRISILFSVVRIVPPPRRLHTLGLISIIFFFLLCGGLIIQKAVWCTHTWKLFNSLSIPGAVFTCSLTRGMTIFELAADCVAESISIALQLHMLRNVNLPRRQRRLLRLIFSATIAISIVSFVRMVAQIIEQLSDLVSIIIDFQMAISLMVCNSLVVVTYLYRVLGYAAKDGSESSSDPTTATDDDFTTSIPNPRSTMQLTTIEFHTSGSSYPTRARSGQEGPSRSELSNDA